MNKKLVNAWIFLNEDEPSGTNYLSPQSCYQRLINKNVYNAVDVLYICFATTVRTSPTTIPAGNGDSWTIQMGASDHPNGLTNQDYMNYIIRDARNQNPNIKICMTLNYGNGGLISQIFSNSNYTAVQNASKFADNLVQYLDHYNIDGFDVDWESPISSTTSATEFQNLFTAIGLRFAGRQNILTLSPASVGNLVAKTVNDNFNFVNLQLYSGFTCPTDFENAGVDSNLFAYGAKFESNFQTAVGAIQDNDKSYNYSIMTNWRLNSNNYVFEQNQQVELYKLFKLKKMKLNKATQESMVK